MGKIGPTSPERSGPKGSNRLREGGDRSLICQWGETRQVCKKVLNRMILLFSRWNVPWTVVHGQPRMLTKILMTAAVRHAAAPTQKQKIAMARASSMLLDRSAL